MNSKPRSLRSLLFISLHTLCCCCCQSANPECVVFEARASALKLEQSDAEVRPTPAAGALVALHWQTSDDEEPVFACTATRVSDHWYLTARHCVAEPADSAPPTAPAPTHLLLGRFAFVQDMYSSCDVQPQRLQPVVNVHVHPSLDIALLQVSQRDAWDDSTQMEVAQSAPQQGSTAFIAGFGLTERASLGDLRSLRATIVGVSSTSLVVQGLGGGACAGDSGGPLYAYDTLSGEALLLGVLSRGSASCLEQDDYVSVAAASDWLGEVLAGN